jgi:hypothetical protein
MNNDATGKIMDLRMRLALSQSDELDLETAIEYVTISFGTPLRSGKPAIYQENRSSSADYSLMG